MRPAAIALDKTVPERDDVAELPIWLITLGEPGERDVHGLRLGDRAIAKKYGTSAAKSLLAVAKESAPALASLLGHKDALVRARVAHVLGLIPSADPAVVDALVDRFRKEESAAVRTSIALAIGYRGEDPALSAKAATAAAELSRTESAPMPKGSLVAARALALGSVDASIEENALRELFAAFGRAQFDSELRESLAWNDGALGRRRWSAWERRSAAWRGCCGGNRAAA